MLLLIVDPDSASREKARRDTEHFGYRCVTAADADEAWDHVGSKQPDVVLMSLRLPGAGGLTLIQRVRSNSLARAPYLIVAIAPSDDDALFAAMSAGADDFLIWPCLSEHLHARLQVAERITLLAGQLTSAQGEVARQRQALDATSRTDGLTQLWNRLQLRNDLDLFQGQLQRYGHRYAAGIIDLDQLGAFNEVSGRIAGDEALRVVADTIVQQLRAGDRAYRYGGDEFVVLLPEQSAETARTAIERIREAVERLELPHAGNPPWHLTTISAGIATFDDPAATTYDALLGLAEAALNRAKMGGGNRVELAT